ncbi:MAG: HAD family hydrolase [Limnochordia bacterium]|mgnify:FL=1
MTPDVFRQTEIAVIWDFDKTLIPGYMQEPLFRHYNVDARTFWSEVKALPDYLRRHGAELVSEDSIYLNHILTYVRTGRFPGLNNALLRELGKELRFYPGLPQFFAAVKDRISNNSVFQRHDIRIEHYIVSTGLRQMILGTAIAPYVDGVWGCEFVEHLPEPGFLTNGREIPADQPHVIRDIAYVLDNTTKTRAIFEINKGVNKFPEIDVNSNIPRDDRRIPFQNMVYIADGPSDVPVFSLVNQNGGRTFAVYESGSVQGFAQAVELQRQGRVHAFGEANYEPGTLTYMWIMHAVEDIAGNIVKKREEALQTKLGRPPRHLGD